MRRSLAISLLLMAFPAVARAAPAPPPERIATGVSVGGVSVAGLTVAKAEIRLRKSVGAAARRAVVVQVAGRSGRFVPERLGVQFNAAASAGAALAAGRLAGGRAVDLPVRLRADRARVLAQVRALASAVRRPARGASLRIGLTKVRVRGARWGRSLAKPSGLARRVRERLADPSSPRTLPWGTRRVRPALTIRALARRTYSIVTVSRRRKLARLFLARRDGGWRRARAYRVAVGKPGFPTPTGRFAVISKVVDPAWTAPGWAGPIAGQTFPGGSAGNPIKARWIGFTGSVGFHGTADLGSLGSEASHGCVRMSVRDVKSLYRKVRIGSPVLVR